ncbi:RNA-binding protein PNO1 [Sesamum alatum]|uniref:RNA-binding protein PNO1 n=1 Tax=Sesamum alatum TaxID=300844 RepID=A0AAE1YHY9_9LAMI|nr:RNA-binding protein PNO1 [Sesamum alatum]
MGQAQAQAQYICFVLYIKDQNPSSLSSQRLGFSGHFSRRRVVEKTDTMQNSTADPANSTAAGMEVDATAVPARQQPVLFAQKPNFRPLKAHEISDGQIQFRKVSVPPHRYTPLKKAWLEIYTPIYEEMKIDIRMNLKARRVELKTRSDTPTSATSSKCADFVHPPSCLASM